MAEKGPYWLGATLQELEGEDFSAYGVSKEDGGVALVKAPAQSAAAKVGFKDGDLIQGLNEIKVKTVSDLLRAYTAAGSGPMTIKLVRNQQAEMIKVDGVPSIELKTDGAPKATDAKVSAKGKTSNESLETLVDGALAANYGPIFGNGTVNGAYKLDLGSVKEITALTSWTHNYGGTRGPQIVSLYGSASEKDPGWVLGDMAKFTPIGSFDTTKLPAGEYLGVTLRAPSTGGLGSYRWIIWEVEPVTARGENSAFQELSVE